MAQQIQAHGPGLIAKSKNCREGELFVYYNTTLNKKELYVFTSNGTTESPATYKRLGIEDVMAYRKDIETLPTTPETNAVYRVTKKIAKGTKNPQFLKDDIVLWDGTQWIKFAGAGSFDNKNTRFEPQGIETVQDALVFLSRNPFEVEQIDVNVKSLENDYVTGGIIQSSKEYKRIDLVRLLDEKLYNLDDWGLRKTAALVRVNFTDFVGLSSDFKVLVDTSTFNSDNLIKSVLVLVQSTETNLDLVEISHNYTVIDFVGAVEDSEVAYKVKERGSLDATNDYKVEDAGFKHLSAIFDSIYKTKADLDKNGKIYLSQLPDTILGATEYKGTLEVGGTEATPATIAETIPLENNTDTAAGKEKTHKGDYWIAKTDGWLKLSDTEVLQIHASDFIIVDEADDTGLATKVSVVHREVQLQGLITPDGTTAGRVTLSEAFVELKETARVQIVGSEANQDITLDTTAKIPEIADTFAVQTVPIVKNSSTKDKNGKTRRTLSPSKISQDDTNKKVKVSDYDLAMSKKLTDSANKQVNFEGKFTYPTTQRLIDEGTVDNTETTENVELEYKLPSHSGTLATEEGIAGALTNPHIPFAKKDAARITRLVDSPVSVDEEDKNVKLHDNFGVAFTSDNMPGAESKDMAEGDDKKQILKGGSRKTANGYRDVTFKLDSTNVGYRDSRKTEVNLLHEDSVIDGGYWE